MELKIKSTNIVLTPEIKEYLNKKLSVISKLVDAEDPTLLAEVELGKTTRHHRSGNIFRAEVNLRVSGENLRAVAEEDDLNAAIDEVRDGVWRELRSLKGRRLSFLRRGGQKIKKFLRRFYK